MRTEVHILAYNEARILPYTIRHYKTFAAKIVIHDLGSTDGTQKIAADLGCEIVQRDCGNSFDDRLNKNIKQDSWKGTDADWVIQADTDELIYFPAGTGFSMDAYNQQGLIAVKPYGYEMTSDVWPTGDGQIYDEVKMGARDDRWYAKPIMFSPKRCSHVEFSTGAHTCAITLHDGRRMPNPTITSIPSCYLLHFHHIGPLHEIAMKYDANLARQSAINRQMRWGNQEPGIKHATDKRNMIHAKLERVIA